MHKKNIFLFFMILLLTTGCAKKNVMEEESTPLQIAQYNAASMCTIENNVYYLNQDGIYCNESGEFKRIIQEQNLSNLYAAGDCLYVFQNSTKLYQLDNHELALIVDLSDNNYWTEDSVCLEVSGDYIVWANPNNTSEEESKEEWYCYNKQQSQTVCILDESDYGYDCWLQDNDLYIHNESQVNKIDLQTKENKVLYSSTIDIEISGIYVYKENVVLGIRNLQEETRGYYLYKCR